MNRVTKGSIVIETGTTTKNKAMIKNGEEHSDWQKNRNWENDSN